MPKEWTAKEEKFLRERHEELTNAELAQALGVSVKSVEGKLRRLKLKRKRKTGPKSKVSRKKVAKAVMTPEEERRAEAVREFEEGVRMWMEGRSKEAIEQFRTVSSEYPMVLDVVWAAKHYMERCKTVDKEDAAGGAED